MADTVYWFTRLLVQRGMGLTYLLAFLVAANQFRGLIGKDGLEPVKDFVKRINFWQKPSIFHGISDDWFIALSAWTGVFLSLLTVTGLSERFGTSVSIAVWLLLWILYLSFVNVGQTFWGFGWESMLLEAGFLTIFLGAYNTATPVLIIWLFRWLLFRNMFGAGLIKLRGDRCWWNLTCMDYHYETQPMPNPLSWLFDKLPGFIHKASVLVNHFVELVVPFFYFAPQPFAAVAGAITILFQLWLMLSGNFSWLNFLTAVLAFSTFSDSLLQYFIPISTGSIQTSGFMNYYLAPVVFILVVVLSYWPIKNMISPSQAMNFSYNPFHLVNTYGAFGSITKDRYELVVQGTRDENLEDADWKTYRFKGKPTDLSSIPPQWAPYHLRLDWQMWFAAMSSRPRRRWFPRFVQKLLEGEEKVTDLLKDNPFPEKPPRYVRVRRYVYRFTSWSEWWDTGRWWDRELFGEYMEPVSEQEFPLNSFRNPFAGV